MNLDLSDGWHNIPGDGRDGDTRLSVLWGEHRYEYALYVQDGEVWTVLTREDAEKVASGLMSLTRDPSRVRGTQQHWIDDWIGKTLAATAAAPASEIDSWLDELQLED